MTRVLTSLLVACVALSASALAAPRVDVTQYPDAVVVYVHDLDLLRAHAKAPMAEIAIDDGATCRVDLAAECQTPALLVSKRGTETCRGVKVVIRDGDMVLFDKTLPAGPVVQSAARVRLTQEKAFIEPGKRMGAAPEIAQPDLANLPALALAPATRTVDVAKITAQVLCDRNYPLISAQNNCVISRQTAHPDDPGKRSIYVPLKTQLYDAKTGRPTRVAHYLAEIEIDPAWVEGKGDAEVVVPPAKTHILFDESTWPPKPNGQWVLGQAEGGLGQGSYTVSVDNDGNIYYSCVPPTVVRYNVRKGKFEIPPIDLDAALQAFLPKLDTVPEASRRPRENWDSYKQIVAGDNRLYIIPVRNGVYGAPANGVIYWNGVLSIPLAHWDDAAAFAKDVRMHVASWPTAERSLYKTWPEAGDAGRKMGSIFFAEGSFYASSYPGAHGGPWTLALDGQGAVKTFQEWDPKKAAPVFHNMGLKAQPKLPEAAPGRIDWWNYGMLEAERSKLKEVLTGSVDRNAAGKVTVYYDVLAAMRVAGERFRDLLAASQGPSLAPCYMAAAIPDKPGHLLGVGEYGYYLADLDVTRAGSGKVPKTYLPLALEAAGVRRPLRVGLGPYGHTWLRLDNARYLFIGGYTGLTRLRYSVDGKSLDAFQMEPINATDVSLDDAHAGGIKREQYLMPGLDGRIFLTGTHTAARAGTAWSGGLMSFNARELKVVERLSNMSRAYWTGPLRARVRYQADGTAVQDFALRGSGADKGYILKMDAKDVPQNQEAKVFLYDYVAGGRPRDLFGFSMPKHPDGAARLDGLAFSRDRRYLILVSRKALLTFDLAARRYVDAKAIDADIYEFEKPDYLLNRAPDDRLLLCLAKANEPRATFYEVAVSPAGELSLAPCLAVTGVDAAAVGRINHSVIAFVPDPKGDGSYDLALGPYWRTQDTTMRIIPDFIAPRN